MRVIAGTAKGRRLKAPRGPHVRPTSEKIRGALFNILGDVSGLRVLDLFAGTGALGIEALSRGASHATFVDDHPSALKLVRENVVALGFLKQAEFRRLDLSRHTTGWNAEFDLVFCDPPYGFKSMDKVLYSAVGPALKAGALALVEQDRRDEFAIPAELVLVEQRRWGSTVVNFLRRASDG